MAKETPAVSDVRVTSALVVAIVGMLILAVLVGYLASPNWTADNVVAVVGLFTSVLGTIVGAFLGVQVGAAGKAKADENAAKAEDKAAKAQELANLAMAALPPEAAQQVMESSRR